MNRAEMLREIRMARFEEIYDRWRRKRVTQAWAASVLGVTDRTFRRWVARYEAGGLAALKDKRVAGPSPRRASPEEVEALEALYRDGCAGWNVLHFYHEVYAGEQGGARSYTWVKSRLQEAGLVRKGRRKGAHRLRRERKPTEGMHAPRLDARMGSRPGVGPGVTMDDASSGVYSGFFVEEEGTWSSVAETAVALLAHGKVDKDKPDGRAMRARDRDDRRVLAAGAGPASGCSRFRGAYRRSWRGRGSPWTRPTSS